MGISEAFYIPAALALITDYHRGSTRSIATGLHMSGIYVGMAVAGFGATMASWTGWRMTFALFGLIGVAYAVILILFLKDPSKAPADTAQAKKPSVPEEKRCCSMWTMTNRPSRNPLPNFPPEPSFPAC